MLACEPQGAQLCSGIEQRLAMAHQRHLAPTFGPAFGIPAPVVSPSENDILIRQPSRECLYL